MAVAPVAQVALVAPVAAPATGEARADATLAPADVVFHRCHAATGEESHDHLSKRAVARSIAELLGVPFAGDLDALNPTARLSMVVPTDTIHGNQAAHDLGIDGAGQLFGGVVPHAFVASKVITHPLIRSDAQAPAGWSQAFGAAVAHVVLPGFSVFTPDDALRAGKRMLEDGSVRVKQPDGVGGAGQAVVRNLEELSACIDACDSAHLLHEGLVLERNLQHVTTFSVGLVQVGAWRIAYVGTQRLTPNHRGDLVYGGSRLMVARGAERELLALALTPEQRTAVNQAMVYHHAAFAAFPGLMATRCNYDAVAGVDDAGKRCAGVLEQSWRIGGASAAEVAALQAFRADASLQKTWASTVETYGEPGEVPVDASVHFDGIDAHVGRLFKYATVEPHVDT